MRDNMKACQHTLTDDVVYKEVVVIGNGPSGMVTSFMLAGNVPYLKHVPADLPIDDMLRVRLNNLPEGQSLYEADLMELAEGLEGRSHNPIPLLMDNLLRPCADLGIQADSLIEWKFDIEKQVEHVVLGRGPAGGSWHTFPAGVRTLSPGAWLALPPHAAAGAPAARLPARAVAHYCRRYVHTCGLQRYFRSGVVVSSVTRCAPPPSPPCDNRACPLNAKFCVAGYSVCERRLFRYRCGRVVVCCGARGRPGTLAAARAATTSLAHLERAAHLLAHHERESPGSHSVLVVGSGVSGADAVLCVRRAGLRARHVHRAPALALARLAPHQYPDYCQVYQMMCDGPSGNHPNYTSYPDHVIVDVTTLPGDTSPKLELDDFEENALAPKRVTLLNLATNETEQITVSLITVHIGSKPDLFFLQTNFDINDCIQVKKCIKCDELPTKRKIEDEKAQCFFKNHWLYLKTVVGQSIQICKSRYLNYTEINGNTDTKCIIPNCNTRPKCTCLVSDIENGSVNTIKDCKCNIPYSDEEKCTCDQNPYSGGLGFGIDPKKPVDGRSNPIAIDKSTHEVLNAPKGMYALGPLTADNFVRFIPGGALAAVANIHKENKT